MKFTFQKYLGHCLVAACNQDAVPECDLRHFLVETAAARITAIEAIMEVGFMNVTQ